MQTRSTSYPSRQVQFHQQSETTHVSGRSSGVARALAIASSTLLIGASTGFGAFYAGTQGAEQGIFFAGLLVAMALGLELAKPFSIAAAIHAFRRWRVAQGALLAVLGLVAVAYSLSAELSLMATARGDRVAERAAASNVATQVRNRYTRAKLELDGIPAARPAAELQSLIDGILIDPRAGGCVVLDGPFTREHCPKVAEWRAEQARAQRRTELEATMHAAEANMASGPVAKTADPGAAALAAYLVIFGFEVEPNLLTEALILVGVLALEVGSALSVVLVQAAGGRTPYRAPPARQEGLTSVPEPQPVVHVVHPTNMALSDDTANTRAKVKKAILNQLNQKGGSLAGSERGLAALIGANRSTVRRAVHGLVAAGLIALEASRNGTVLRLVT